MAHLCAIMIIRPTNVFCQGRCDFGVRFFVYVCIDIVYQVTSFGEHS
jgi:hypothetical protein